MTDNSQMTEQIFTNIDALGKIMEDTIDLSSDVAPFMSSTLAKIKQLGMAKDGDYGSQYELFQIATNYLPRTINAYCSLPIEYRNTHIVKSDKTARQLLIDNLKLFKEQIIELEKQFYAPIENQIKVDSSFIREKYAKQIELATELDKVGDDGFVNQFNYSEYKESPHYKDITFKRELSQEEVQAKQRSEEINKKISYVGEKAQNFGGFLLNGAFSILKVTSKGAALFFAGLLEVIGVLIGPIIVVGVVGGIITVVVVTFKDNNMESAVVDASTQIHLIMKTNVIPSSEFTIFANSKTKELIDDSDYRKEMLTVTFNNDKQILSIQVKDLAKDLCMDLIDKKEEKFDFVSVKVNGLSLPQDNTVSDYRYWKTENHNLCHLDDDNKVTLDFDNKIIYDVAHNGVSLTESQKAAKIDSLEKELINIEVNKYHKYESYFNEMKEKVKVAIDKVKSIKTVNAK